MVTFICSACGQSLKKNQVEKHCTTVCRRCEMLSCVDCLKEFWGNDYVGHIKCISEEEKYSGKLYKAKPGGNKGEVKQETWTQQVQSAIVKMEADGAVKTLLQQIRDCTNIPRKQAKFQNFLKNSMRIKNERLVSRAWEAIQAEIQNESNNNEDKDEVVNTNDDDKVISNGHIQKEDETNEKKKKKKRKKEREEDEEENEKTETKVAKTDELSETDASMVSLKTFSWSDTIHNILLRAPNHQLSIRKARKKFLKEFKENGENVSNYAEERISSKLDRKLSSNSKWTLENDIVKLKQ